VQGDGLDVEGGVNLPFGTSWAATNIQDIMNFTNAGVINIIKTANAGADRDLPYNHFINRGTDNAGAHFVRTLNFDNSGSLIASAGPLLVDTLTASMMGSPVTIVTNVTTNFGFTPFPPFVSTNASTNVITLYGPLLQGPLDLQLFADSLAVSNSAIQAAISRSGSLIISVTNQLTDSPLTSTNLWTTFGDLQMLTRPVTSELLGTYITSVTAGFEQETFHLWPADDRGPTVDGYNNNLALGKLTLDGGRNGLFHFSPPPGQTGKALYVDYLELLNFATNYNDAIDISPDFAIYFANANVNPLKLDRSTSGRLHWVRDYTGPLSSTNITYPSGNTYTFNTALCQSLDLDSDGDGIVNGIDPTPIFVGASVALTVTRTNLPQHQVLLSWHTMAHSTNRVEYLSTPNATNWQVLTNIINGPTNAVLRAQDAMPPNGQRFYRVHVDLK
jgi:hypothetical protein